MKIKLLREFRFFNNGRNTSFYDDAFDLIQCNHDKFLNEYQFFLICRMRLKRLNKIEAYKKRKADNKRFYKTWATYFALKKLKNPYLKFFNDSVKALGDSFQVSFSSARAFGKTEFLSQLYSDHYAEKIEGLRYCLSGIFGTEKADAIYNDAVKNSRSKKSLNHVSVINYLSNYINKHYGVDEWIYSVPEVYSPVKYDYASKVIGCRLTKNTNDSYNVPISGLYNLDGELVEFKNGMMQPKPRISQQCYESQYFFK